ncbi:MAG: MATE family efflux transporter [Clostridiales bacterium]|nr:MATE family efflux transporter [Clostridiales bacterium]
MSTAVGKKNNITDLTKGDPLKVILLFALPIYLSNILQQFYNLTDISIIGHSLGDDALSAIGSVSTIFGLFNSLLFGMGNGFSLVVSKHFGAQDEKKLKTAVANTLFIGIAWGAFITVAGFLSIRPLMNRLLNVPESLYDMAYGYISVVILLVCFSFSYNILSGLLRAIGDSRTPLYILVVSVTLNICLDLLFIRKFHWGLPGAAFATAASQAVSALIALVYIMIRVPELHISRKDMVLSKPILADLFTSGLAFALMFSIVNIGTLILQSAINGFGPEIIEAHTMARKLSEPCMMMVGTLATAMATFGGQNYGAGKFDRVKEGLRKTMICSFVLDALLILMVYTIGPLLVRLVSGSSNAEVIDTAAFYLKFDLPFYFVLSVVLITRNTLQGIGGKYVPLIASAMELILKVITAKKLSVMLGYLGIVICEPIIWTVCAVFILLAFALRIKKLKKGQV